MIHFVAYKSSDFNSRVVDFSPHPAVAIPAFNRTSRRRRRLQPHRTEPSPPSTAPAVSRRRLQPLQPSPSPPSTAPAVAVATFNRTSRRRR
ncbi:hypothetical protein LINPERPRIM_LOCUS18776, partial [Linum perenne]